MATASARVARQSGTSFYYALRILPSEKRQAMYALYSFCRLVDDCVDEESGEGAAGLERWLREVDRCYAGSPETELGRELAAAIERFPIPRARLEEIVEGCRMDLTTRRYAHFDDLLVYCRHVASAVGLASIEIFGYRDPRTRDYARELGIALQLTNILRDVGADAGKGRIYVPLEDLERFGIAEAELLGAARGEAERPKGMDALGAFEAERTRRSFETAKEALPPEDARAMVSAEVMRAVYETILEEVVREAYPLDRRVGLSSRRKMWIALKTALKTVLAP